MSPTVASDRGAPSAASYDVTSGQTLWALAERWAALRADAPALVTLTDYSGHGGVEVLSWGQFVEQVGELRRRLASLGVSDQRTVLMALPNSPATVGLWTAIQANGAIVQALDPDTGILEIERALAATRPILVLADASNRTRVSKGMGSVCPETRLLQVPVAQTIEALLADSAALPRRSVALLPEATPELIAGLLPTSGTSGASKLVELTHRNYVMSAERLARNSGYLASDRHYLCSPFFHTNAQLYICAPPFATGGSIAIVPKFSATHYFDAARATGATTASMVAPPMRLALHKAVDRGAVDPGDLRLVQYGMQMSSADWKHWDRLVPQIEMRQIFGQTESVTGVLGGAPWETDDRRTIGRPFVGVEAVRLVGQHGDDVPQGTSGELWVKGTPGITLMRGYLDAPDLTERTLVDGQWLRTGDVMVRHEDGRFEFCGRSMHIIRRGGENLSTYALELDLQACPYVQDVAITAEEDATLDAIVIAHLIPSPGFLEAEFMAWCRENLGKRGVPDAIRLHASFPRTGSGRVITRDLI